MDHVYNADGGCLTCFNNPLTGEPLNHDGQSNEISGKSEAVAPTQETQQTSTTSKTQKAESYVMHEVKYNTDTNVDVAFIILKDEFQFRSAEEVKKEMGSYADFKLRSSDYEWKVMPGVSYTMGSAREIKGSRMNLIVTINKRTDSTSLVIAKFWPRDKNLDANIIGEHLVARIEKALGN